MLTDYHVHLRPDEKDATPETHFTRENVALYEQAAREAGIPEFGFSEHVYRFRQALEVWDHPFWREWATDDLDYYCEFVDSGPGKLGIEADFIPGREDRIAALLEGRGFDYVIGSVHFLGDRSLDTDQFTVWETGRDPDEIWSRYFETVAEAARSGLFDVIAHPDLVKVWGRAERTPGGELEAFYGPLVEAVAETGIAVEISTAGLRKAVGEIYPSDTLTAMLVEAGAEFTLSSDAHLPEQVGYGYGDALDYLARHGIERLAVFDSRRRMLVAIDEAGGE